VVEVLDHLGIRAVLAIKRLERLPATCRSPAPPSDAGGNSSAPGFTQRNMQKVDDERVDIRKTAAAIRGVTGKTPRGWLGPGPTETWETPDPLVEEGSTMSATGCSTTSPCG
jgi:hypothetical protein